MIPVTDEAYKLLHEGSIALAQVEANGMRIDLKYLDKAIRKTERRIKHLTNDIHESEVMKIWRKTFRSKTNINSRDQLGIILFDKMGFECVEETETGKPKTDEKSLSTVDHPFVKDYLAIKKLDKALSTYLLGLKREVVDGFIHPVFNLHLVNTYRSSSDSPNFQNIPIRNPKIAKLVRTAFIPRDGNHIVELDYGGLEVCIAACYHKDPNMISYINDSERDMHRDMAMECFKLEQHQVTKEIRYCGKNMFVFPQFYGDWYMDCARHLWEAIPIMNLETTDGIPLRKHLYSKGIKELGDMDPNEKPRKGTFEGHIRKVEKRFWNDRFPVYTRWKKRWYESYKSKGYFVTKTGFTCQGFMKRNEVINYPVQGSAFHCLLWSLIQLVQKDLRKAKMKTLICGQIHDSIVADVPADEKDDFLELAHEVMVDRLLETWDWINVPLEIGVEVAPLNASWAEKEEVQIG